MANTQVVASVVQGFIALLTGNAEHLVWVDQTDAQAFTDGEKIYLPKPQGLEGEREILLAMALREVGRIQHCATGVMSDLGSDLAYPCALEDARIKQEMATDYKGAKAFFDEAMPHIQRAFMQPDNELNPQALKPLLVWAESNDAYLGTDASGQFLDIIRILVQPEIPDGIGDALHGMCQAAPWLRNTQASHALGMRIKGLLEPQTPLPSPPAAGSEGEQGDGEGAAADSSDMANGSNASPSPDGGDSGDQSGQNASSMPPTAAGASQAEQTGSEAASGDADQVATQAESSQTSGTPGSDPLSDALARLKGHSQSRPSDKSADQLNAECDGQPASDVDPQLSQALQDALEKGQMQSLTAVLEQSQDDQSAEEGPADAEAESAIDLESAQDDEQEVQVPSMPSGTGVGDGAGAYTPYEFSGATQNRLGAVSSRMVSALLKVLQAERRRPSGAVMQGRDVHASRLWRMKRLGDLRVFKHRPPKSGIDAAMHVYLDQSGSMDDWMEQAAQVAYAFVLAGQRISGFQTALSLFPSGEIPVEQVLHFRRNACTVESRLKSVKAKGGTPTHLAIQHGRQSLEGARAERKYMLLITDGDPDNWEATYRQIELAESEGIEILGIGMGSQARKLKHLVTNSELINSVDDLPEALKTIFQQVVHKPAVTSA